MIEKIVQRSRINELEQAIEVMMKKSSLKLKPEKSRRPREAPNSEASLKMARNGR